MANIKSPLGVLVLHGLTSSLDCVNGLVPYLEKEGLPYRLPVLRGHGTRYQDLEDVHWSDWYADASSALDHLLGEVDQVAVVGLSMGGLLALKLAIDRPQRLAGLVTVAAALHLNSPLAYGSAPGWLRRIVFPIYTRTVKTIDMVPLRADPSLLVYNTNYAKVPTAAVVWLFELASLVEAGLSNITLPIRVLQSRADTTVKPESAQIIYDRVSSIDKKLIWFTRSEHEMMMDVERETVFNTIMEFLRFV